MAENLPENNVKYITRVLKSLREKLSDAKELNLDNTYYQHINKEYLALISYLDNLRFTHGAEIKPYDDELIEISVDLGNLNKNINEYTKESDLEVEVDSSGTSFG